MFSRRLERREMKHVTQGVSEIVGSVNVEGRGSEKVYRALRPLICASCGVAIEEGALFTRREHASFALHIMPTCAECVPFTWPEDATRPDEGSSLIESLLTTTQDSERVHSVTDTPTQKKVESRLAPALSRSLRNRDKRSPS